MSNTITAYFKGRVGVAESVYQNDYGIVMAFDSIDLPAHFDCFFSRLNQEEALPGLGADNRVTIPNSILANPGNVTIHIPLHTGEDDSEVEYVIYFKVIGRARPIDDGTPAQMTAIERALALLSQPITNIEEIVNEALSFTGDTFAEMKEELQNDQTAFESEINTDFENLNAQFQTAVSALTVDSEVQNIRVGDDNITYSSAGEAVRKQFSKVKSDLGIITDTTANLWDETWEVGGISSVSGDNDDLITNRIRSKGFIPVDPLTTYWVAAPQTVYIFEYDEDYEFFGIYSGKKNETVKTNSDTHYIRINPVSEYGNVYHNNILIAKSFTQVDYIPHTTAYDLEARADLKKIKDDINFQSAMDTEFSGNVVTETYADGRKKVTTFTDNTVTEEYYDEYDSLECTKTIVIAADSISVEIE